MKRLVLASLLGALALAGAASTMARTTPVATAVQTVHPSDTAPATDMSGGTTDDDRCLSTSPPDQAKPFCEEQKGPGKVYFVSDTDPGHLGKGALEFDTRDTNGLARLSHRENNRLVSDLTQLAYATRIRQLSSLSSSLAPTLTLTVTTPPVVQPGCYVGLPTGPPVGSAFVTLVWEPGNAGQQAVQLGSWQHWDASAATAGWRTTSAYGDFSAGSSKSFQQVKDCFGTSAVNTIGINQGSGNPGLLARADDLRVNDVIYDFEVPAISTQATPMAMAGQSISDTATVTGVYSASSALPGPLAPPASTGTVTFKLYPPTDPSCLQTPVFTSTKPATQDGSVQSDPYVPGEVGDYHWVATYSGDANNAPVTGVCGEEGETSRVTSSPTLVTQASAPVTVGAQISDTATVSGIFTEPSATSTGTLVFDLYGPADPTCAGPPYASSMPVTVRGNGVYNSGAFTTTSVGTYRFIARYSGDGFNAPAEGKCNDANERTEVTKSPSTLSTKATNPSEIGQPISDTATVQQVYAQPGATSTGTITFKLYEPPTTVTTPGSPGPAPEPVCTTVLNGAPPPVGGVISTTICKPGASTTTTTEPCAGTPVFTAVVSVNGSGSYRSPDYRPTMLGTYTWVATYSGDANNTAASGACGDPNEQTTVTQARAQLTTSATSPAAVGTPISDTATITGLYAPSGSTAKGAIVFDLYGPADTACTAATVFQSSKPVNGDGVYRSDPYTPTALGTYRWIATYVDSEATAYNARVAGTCNDPGELSQVTKASPSVATQATPSAKVGQSISDTATVSGAYQAAGATTTGTITFRVYGPADPACSGTPVFTSGPKPVTGTGPVVSDPYTPTAAGTYLWIASFTGDANNADTAGACGEARETSAVGKAAPVLTTQASATATVGQSISDTATVSGAYQAPGATSTGTITFRLYGPADPSCAGTAVFTSGPKPVAGSGPVVSDAYPTTAAGDYHWIASFTGDANNADAAGRCGEEGETSAVRKAKPTLTTKATATRPVGQPISDTATVSGAYQADTATPTGTITFRLYGASDPSCAGTPVFSSGPKPVNGADPVASDPYTPTTAGTYRWIASFTGDANNDDTAGACNDPDEQTVVTSTGRRWRWRRRWRRWRWRWWWHAHGHGDAYDQRLTQREQHQEPLTDPDGDGDRDGHHHGV